MLRRVFGNAAIATAVVCVLVPSAASAQSGITGLVKDASGGVLPGVTVEATSPALIEKARTVVTDTQGRFAIIDLRPGIYKVTFTLSGFSTAHERVISPPRLRASRSGRDEYPRLVISA